MIYDDVLAAYPDVFSDRPRATPPRRSEFADLHQHLHEVAELIHAHLRHVQETIMDALANLNSQADALEQSVDNTVIPALDALMSAAGQVGVPEAQVQAASDRIQTAIARLTDKAREAHTVVGGEG